MEWVETAVMRRAGLRGEMLMFSSPAAAAGHCQHPLLCLQGPLSSSSAEEPACATSVDRSGGGGAWENFSVDDLLDLGGGNEQNGGEDDFLRAAEAEDDEEEDDDEEEEEEEEKEGKEHSSTGFNPCTPSALSFPAPPASSDPIVPAGDLADLEWVSRFVDDSYSEFPSAVAPAVPQNHHHAPPAPAPVEAAAEAEAFKAQSTTSSGITAKRTTWGSCCSFSTDSLAVPAKSRSKRSRSAGRAWSLGLPPLLSESSTSSCSSGSSSASCSASSSISSCLLYEKLGGGCGWGGPHPFLDGLGGGNPVGFQPGLVQVKKKKKGRKPKAPAPMGASAAAAAAGSGGGGEPQARRRCSHCGVDRTPQWRAGPMGAKTLCNACGVRYKSGRLLPEYRPAGSPTFLSHVHSNSHRKVLEMRRKKELLAGAASPPTASCSLPPLPPVASQPYGVV